MVVLWEASTVEGSVEESLDCPGRPPRWRVQLKRDDGRRGKTYTATGFILQKQGYPTEKWNLNLWDSNLDISVVNRTSDRQKGRDYCGINGKRKDRCITKYLCCETESLQPRGWIALCNDEAVTGSDEELPLRINYTCNYVEKTALRYFSLRSFKRLAADRLGEKKNWWEA